MRSLKILGFSVLILAFFSGCNNSGKKPKTVTKDRIEGYKGEAMRNPYLVAQKFLTTEGSENVLVRNGFVRYDYNLGMLVAPASTLGSEVTTDKMLNWVANGGVYVCLLQRGEKGYIDLGERCEHDTTHWEPVESDSLRYLMDQMQVELVKDTNTLTNGGENYWGEPKSPVVLGEELPLALDLEVNMGHESYRMKLGGTHTMKLTRSLRNGDYYDNKSSDGTHRFLGLKYGEGRVYFMSDARAFRNPYLAMADHASVIESMMDETSYYGDIVFTFNKKRGFWDLMHSYAWPALIGVFVLLVFWLWKSIPRFGPLLEVSDEHDRDYLESVRNHGHFLWGHKRYQTLLDPLRNEIYSRSSLFNDDGEVSPAMVETLAEMSGVSEDDVLEALSRNENIDGQRMVEITRNLQTILKSL